MKYYSHKWEMKEAHEVPELPSVTHLAEAGMKQKPLVLVTQAAHSLSLPSVNYTCTQSKQIILKPYFNLLFLLGS